MKKSDSATAEKWKCGFKILRSVIFGTKIKRCFDIKWSALEIAEFLVDCRIEIGYNIISDN